MKRLEQALQNERKRKSDAERRFLVSEKRVKMVRLKEKIKAVTNETDLLEKKTKEYQDEIYNSEFGEEGKKVHSQH